MNCVIVNFAGHMHMFSVCHDHGHVSQGQGRDDDDGGERGEEDSRRGEGRAPDQETQQDLYQPSQY